MRTFFTADHHFGHTNIIQYCARPFKDLEHMNLAMIKRWNETVTPDDFIYYLGDFCLGGSYVKLLGELDFREMVFIPGNHDPIKKLQNLGDTRIRVQDNDIIKINNRDVFLTHSPLDSSESLPTLCGHVHEHWLIQRPGDAIEEYRGSIRVLKRVHHAIINVGVDQHDFRPVSSEIILELLEETSGKI